MSEGVAIMSEKRWTYTGAKARKAKARNNKSIPPSEKEVITAACENLIASFFIPKFLPEIRPTEFNYGIAIYGKWHGNSYRFITRYRSDSPNSITPEFDAPFTRLEYVSKDCFGLSYMRHTGQWHRLFERLSLAEALESIETMIHFHPSC